MTRTACDARRARRSSSSAGRIGCAAAAFGLLLVVLTSSAQIADAIYEEQAGAYDWHRRHIGLVSDAKFLRSWSDGDGAPVRRTIAVITENKVLAVLNQRDGEIIWRRHLESDASIDRLEIFGNHLLTSSTEEGGKASVIRCWDVRRGAMLWQTTLATAVDVAVTEDAGTVVVLQRDGLTVLGFAGDTQRFLPLAPEGFDAMPSAVFISGEDAFIVGATTDDKAHVLQLALASSATEQTPRARLAKVSKTVRASRRADAIFNAAGPTLWLSSYVGDAVVEISFAPDTSGGPPKVSTLKVEPRHAIVPTGAASTIAFATRPNEGGPSNLLFSTSRARSFPLGIQPMAEDMKAPPPVVTPPYEADGSTWVAAVYSEGGTLIVSIVDASDGIVLKSEAYPLPSKEFGNPTFATLAGYKKKSGGTGFRVLVGAARGALALLQQREAVWIREEALASVGATVVVDFPGQPSAAMDANAPAQPAPLSLSDQVTLHALKLRVMLHVGKSLRLGCACTHFRAHPHWTRAAKNASLSLSLSLSFMRLTPPSVHVCVHPLPAIHPCLSPPLSSPFLFLLFGAKNEATAAEVSQIRALELRKRRVEPALFDPSGFRKQILGYADAAARLFALHASDGRVLWSLNMPQGRRLLSMWVSTEGSLNAGATVALLFRKVKRKGGGACYLTIVDAAKGVVVSETSLALDGDVVMALPKAHPNAPQPVLLVSTEASRAAVVGLEPGAPPPELGSTFPYLVSEDRGAVTGFAVSDDAGEGKGEGEGEGKGKTLGLLQLWRFRLPEGERLASAAAPDFAQKIYSRTRVLGDRSALYKYVNPNVLLVASETAGTKGKENRDGDGNGEGEGEGEGEKEKEASSEPVLTLYLLDTVTGKLLYRINHKGASGPVHSVFHDNWIVYQYWSTVSERERRITRAWCYPLHVAQHYDTWHNILMTWQLFLTLNSPSLHPSACKPQRDVGAGAIRG